MNTSAQKNQFLKDESTYLEWKKYRLRAYVHDPENLIVEINSLADLSDTETEAIKKRYKVFGPPAMLFFDTHGKMRKDLNFYGFREPDEFIEILNKI